MPLTRDSMAVAIRGYFDACNAADAALITAFFTPEAVHYFPDGSPFGALRGAQAIADCWVRCVRDFGSWWTVDRLLCDADAREAVIEWTHFKPRQGGHLRGDEWYCFTEDGRINQIRAYYACPAIGDVHQLGDYAYEALGYPVSLPEAARRARSRGC